DEQILNIDIPLPPLSVQKKLVTRIEKQFGKIDEAIRLREEAIKLTNQLLPAALWEVFESAEKKKWKQSNLADVSQVFNDGDWIESKDQSSKGIRLIQTGNIGIGQFLNKLSKSRYISEETFQRLQCTEIFPGDILISRLPDPVGRSCVLPETSQRMI